MLKYPAPKRESYTTVGGWSTRPWTEQGVRDVLTYDGYFLKGRHEFESREVARLAGVREDS